MVSLEELEGLMKGYLKQETCRYSLNNDLMSLGGFSTVI